MLHFRDVGLPMTSATIDTRLPAQRQDFSGHATLMSPQPDLGTSVALVVVAGGTPISEVANF